MYSLQHCLRALLIKSIPFAIATDRWHIFQFVRSSSSSKANTHGTGEVGGGAWGAKMWEILLLHSLQIRFHFRKANFIITAMGIIVMADVKLSS